MTIQTKYNIGDRLWFHTGQGPKQVTVGGLESSVMDVKGSVTVSTQCWVREDKMSGNSPTLVPEDNLFRTRAELPKLKSSNAH